MAKKTGKERAADKQITTKIKAEPKPAPEPAAETKPSPVGAEVPLVSLDEVAKMLRITPLQVKQMVQAGRIPGVKVDGQWRFNKDLVYEAFHKRSRGM